MLSLADRRRRQVSSQSDARRRAHIDPLRERDVHYADGTFEPGSRGREAQRILYARPIRHTCFVADAGLVAALRAKDRLGDRKRNRDQGGHHRRVTEQACESRRGGEGRPRLRAPKSKHQRSESDMAFEVGKRVVAESESTSRRPRAGVVEEVLRGDPSPRYRIRWDDGHESIYTPASGALRAEPRPKRQRRSTPRKR